MLQDNEKGVVLIIALVLISVLAIVSVVALITTTTDIKISANYRDGIKAFFIADAGIERAKSEMRTVSFNDVLNGTIGGSPGFLSFGTNTSFAGGTYSVTVTDDDEDGDGIPCPDDADDDCLQNSNGKVIVTSVGSLPNGSKRRIEVVVSQLPVDGLPSAVLFVDNENGDVEEDRIYLGPGTDIDPIADNDTKIGAWEVISGAPGAC